MQDDCPIAFAGRSLKLAERNYAQIEKGMLAIMLGLEKFHHHTYGAHTVDVITDHKPLVSISQKLLSKAPKRLQSMLLHVQPYDIKLSYQPGRKLHITVTLSRAPLLDDKDEQVSVNNLQHSPLLCE